MTPKNKHKIKTSPKIKATLDDPKNEDAPRQLQNEDDPKNEDNPNKQYDQTNETPPIN